MQLDLHRADYVLSTFHGAWTREMNRSEAVLETGKYVNESFTGTSSSRANPFIMLGRKETTEDTGECFGINLIYSGSHYEAVEVQADVQESFPVSSRKISALRLAQVKFLKHRKRC